jgi:hypothetical protein
MNLLKVLPVAVAALIVSMVFVNSPAEAGHGGKCDAGWYDQNTGGHNCKIIPAGHGCTNMGGSYCRAIGKCEHGKYSTGESDACTKCTNGQVSSNQSGSQSCRNCDAGEKGKDGTKCVIGNNSPSDHLYVYGSPAIKTRGGGTRCKSGTNWRKNQDGGKGQCN